MRDLLVAIDAGGSYVKATVFGLDAHEHRTVGKAVALIRPRAGFNERDADLLWETASACVREVLAEIPSARERVCAIGLTGHGNGLYLVDCAGQPTRLAIMASDGRAGDMVRRWSAEGLDERIREASWNALWAGKPGPLLAWLALHERETLLSSFAALGCKDYLAARLTEEVRTEITDASAGGLYDNSTLISWPGKDLSCCGETLDALGIEEHAWLLMTSVPSSLSRALSAAGAVATGLAEGTPVVAGVVDNAAMQHGSGVFDSSTICIGAGTWSINQLLVEASEMTLDRALGSVRPSAANAALHGKALLCEASATSASSFTWALERAVTGTSERDRAEGRDIYEARLLGEGRRQRQLSDPMFLPFIDGSRDEAGARGAWLGLSSATSEEDLLGAVIEGICFEHRRHVERLETPLSARLPVRLSGGPARSATWCQRFADVLARPVEVSSIAELGSVCAASIAGSALGVVPSVAAGVEELGGTWRTFEPDPAEGELVQHRWTMYRRWAERLERETWG